MKPGARILTDFFKVKRTASDNKEYDNIHAGVARGQDPTVAPSLDDQVALGLNVLIIGFDSASHMTWVYDYLVDFLGAVVLEGYNIVGDGTPKALLPILTGKTEWELPEARRSHTDAKPVDGHPWIWKEFKKLGYVTQFASRTSLSLTTCGPTFSRPSNLAVTDDDCAPALFHVTVSSCLAYPTLARLRESAEKRVWQQRRGLVVTHCHHSILCRRSREAPAANQCHDRDATLKTFIT